MDELKWPVVVFAGWVREHEPVGWQSRTRARTCRRLLLLDAFQGFLFYLLRKMMCNGYTVKTKEHVADTKKMRERARVRWS